MNLLTKIAAATLIVSCGGRQGHPSGSHRDEVAQEEAAGSPSSLSSQSATSSASGGNPILLGWYCPDFAGGRGAVEAALANMPGWSSSQEFLDRAVASRRARHFSVFSWTGGQAGIFSVAGATRIGGKVLAAGSYVGAEPCDTLDGLGNVRLRDAECLASTRGCALAVSPLELASGFDAPPYEEDPEDADLPIGGACEVAGALQIDIDGDGIVEQFSLEDLAAGGAPVELPLSKERGAACEKNFAATVAVGAQSDGDANRGALLRVGVVDLDGDGRPEVIFLRSGELLVYGAPHRPGRMDLLGRKLLTFAVLSK